MNVLCMSVYGVPRPVYCLHDGIYTVYWKILFTLYGILRSMAERGVSI